MITIEHINKHLLFEPKQHNEPDAIILLGARGVSGAIARSILNDFEQVGKPDIILCGGEIVKQPSVYCVLSVAKKITSLFNFLGLTKLSLSIKKADFYSEKTEAEYMKDILLGGGIPENKIVFKDNTSKNTGENFKNIESHISNAGYTTATIYTVAYQQRRAIETCKRAIPHLNTLPRPIYPYDLTRKTWLKAWRWFPIIRRVVKGEFNKTNPSNPNSYHHVQKDGKGPFCVPVNIPKLN